MTNNNYIPKQAVNVEALAIDLQEKRQEFNQEILAPLLGITGPALVAKLKGRRAWKMNELIIIASRLGKDYRDYLISAAIT